MPHRFYVWEREEDMPSRRKNILSSWKGGAWTKGTVTRKREGSMLNNQRGKMVVIAERLRRIRGPVAKVSSEGEGLLLSSRQNSLFTRNEGSGQGGEK